MSKVRKRNQFLRCVDNLDTTAGPRTVYIRIFVRATLLIPYLEVKSAVMPEF